MTPHPNNTHPPTHPVTPPTPRAAGLTSMHDSLSILYREKEMEREYECGMKMNDSLWFIRASPPVLSENGGEEGRGKEKEERPALLLDYKWPWPVLKNGWDTLELLRYFIIRFTRQWVCSELSRGSAKTKTIVRLEPRATSDTPGTRNHPRKIYSTSCSATLFIAGCEANIPVHFITMHNGRRTLSVVVVQVLSLLSLFLFFFFALIFHNRLWPNAQLYCCTASFQQMMQRHQMWRWETSSSPCT